ncbi:MAG: YihY/virulence factor BrkB family protein [Cryomorphaceae bacterium]|nr:YihY/virulence factor BrkB family protein [Cryomorphaceae bacterium]
MTAYFKKKYRQSKYWILRFIRLSKYITIPFFQGQSLYDVGRFFWYGVIEGNVTSRAASIAFSFFLALFPSLIFIFSLIPYVPIEGFQEELFELLQDIMPPNSYEAAESTIEDIITNRRGGLLSFGFFMGLIFGANGFNALMTNFNTTVHNLGDRSFWRQEMVAIFITLILALLILVGVTMIIFTESFSQWLVDQNFIPEAIRGVIQIGRWVMMLFIVYISIAILYYFGPANRELWKFFSPGSIIATVLIILASAGFSYYVDNFSQYNKLYGSIGTLLVILLWIYLNSIVLIIGFEFNASIAQAKLRKENLAIDIRSKRKREARAKKEAPYRSK